MTDKEIQEMWKRLRNAKTVSNGIDLMLATDMVTLLIENDRLKKELIKSKEQGKQEMLDFLDS